MTDITAADSTHPDSSSSNSLGWHASFSGVDRRVIQEHYQTLLSNLDVTWSDELTTNTTHLFASRGSSAKVVAAQKHGVRVIRTSWLDDLNHRLAAAAGTDEDDKERRPPRCVRDMLDRMLLPEYNVSPLLGMRISTSEFSSDANHVVKRRVEALGGTFTTYVDRFTTQLVVPTSRPDPSLGANAVAGRLIPTTVSDKVRFCCTSRIPIVEERFLDLMEGGVCSQQEGELRCAAPHFVEAAARSMQVSPEIWTDRYSAESPTESITGGGEAAAAALATDGPSRLLRDDDCNESSGGSDPFGAAVEGSKHGGAASGGRRNVGFWRDDTDGRADDVAMVGDVVVWLFGTSPEEQRLVQRHCLLRHAVRVPVLLPALVTHVVCGTVGTAEQMSDIEGRGLTARLVTVEWFLRATAQQLDIVPPPWARPAALTSATATASRTSPINGRPTTAGSPTSTGRQPARRDGQPSPPPVRHPSPMTSLLPTTCGTVSRSSNVLSRSPSALDASSKQPLEGGGHRPSVVPHDHEAPFPAAPLVVGDEAEAAAAATSRPSAGGLRVRLRLRAPEALVRSVFGGISFSFAGDFSDRDRALCEKLILRGGGIVRGDDHRRSPSARDWAVDLARGWAPPTVGGDTPLAGGGVVHVIPHQRQSIGGALAFRAAAERPTGRPLVSATVTSDWLKFCLEHGHRVNPTACPLFGVSFARRHPPPPLKANPQSGAPGSSLRAGGVRRSIADSVVPPLESRVAVCDASKVALGVVGVTVLLDASWLADDAAVLLDMYQLGIERLNGLAVTTADIADTSAARRQSVSHIVVCEDKLSAIVGEPLVKEDPGAAHVARGLVAVAVNEPPTRAATGSLACRFGPSNKVLGGSVATADASGGPLRKVPFAITVAWLDASVRAGYFVDEQPFLVLSPSLTTGGDSGAGGTSLKRPAAAAVPIYLDDPISVAVGPHGIPTDACDGATAAGVIFDPSRRSGVGAATTALSNIRWPATSVVAGGFRRAAPATEEPGGNGGDGDDDEHALVRQRLETSARALHDLLHTNEEDTDAAVGSPHLVVASSPLRSPRLSPKMQRQWPLPLPESTTALPEARGVSATGKGVQQLPRRLEARRPAPLQLPEVPIVGQQHGAVVGRAAEDSQPGDARRAAPPPSGGAGGVALTMNRTLRLYLSLLDGTVGTTSTGGGEQAAASQHGQMRAAAPALGLRVAIVTAPVDADVVVVGKVSRRESVLVAVAGGRPLCKSSLVAALAAPRDGGNVALPSLTVTVRVALASLGRDGEALQRSAAMLDGLADPTFVDLSVTLDNSAAQCCLQSHVIGPAAVVIALRSHSAASIVQSRASDFAAKVCVAQIFQTSPLWSEHLWSVPGQDASRATITTEEPTTEPASAAMTSLLRAAKYWRETMSQATSTAMGPFSGCVVSFWLTGSSSAALLGNLVLAGGGSLRHPLGAMDLNNGAARGGDAAVASEANGPLSADAMFEWLYAPSSAGGGSDVNYVVAPREAASKALPRLKLLMQTIPPPQTTILDNGASYGRSAGFLLSTEPPPVVPKSQSQRKMPWRLVTLEWLTTVLQPAAAAITAAAGEHGTLSRKRPRGMCSSDDAVVLLQCE